MAVRKRVKGFTLPETVIAMLLFSMVMAVSGVALSSTSALLSKETEKTVSNKYIDGAADYITDCIRYGINIDFTASLQSSDGVYDKYLDVHDPAPGAVTNDTVLYIHDGRIDLVEAVSGGHPSVSSPLFAADGMELKLESKLISGDRVEFTLYELDARNNTEVFRKIFTARKLNSHTGYFNSEGGREQYTDGYYICIDNDYNVP